VIKKEKETELDHIAAGSITLGKVSAFLDSWRVLGRERRRSTRLSLTHSFSYFPPIPRLVLLNTVEVDEGKGHSDQTLTVLIGVSDHGVRTVCWRFYRSSPLPPPHASPPQPYISSTLPNWSFHHFLYPTLWPNSTSFRPPACNNISVIGVASIFRKSIIDHRRSWSH